MSDQNHKPCGSECACDSRSEDRQRVLEVATEIYTAGIPKGCVSRQHAEQPYSSPTEAVEKAVELIEAVDNYFQNQSSTV